MMGQAVGAGSESGTITIPGAPTGASFGFPLVFASINVVSTNMYIIMVNSTARDKFQYHKRFYNGSGINAATAEHFNYVAYWF
jgi:hypothetical protein